MEKEISSFTQFTNWHNLSVDEQNKIKEFYQSVKKLSDNNNMNLSDDLVKSFEKNFGEYIKEPIIRTWSDYIKEYPEADQRFIDLCKDVSLFTVGKKLIADFKIRELKQHAYNEDNYPDGEYIYTFDIQRSVIDNNLRIYVVPMMAEKFKDSYLIITFKSEKTAQEFLKNNESIIRDFYIF